MQMKTTVKSSYTPWEGGEGTDHSPGGMIKDNGTFPHFKWQSHPVTQPGVKWSSYEAIWSRNYSSIYTWLSQRNWYTQLYSWQQTLNGPTVLELKAYSPPIQSNTTQQFKGGGDKKE